MDKLKKARKPLRTAVTKTINEAEDQLTSQNPDASELKDLFEKLECLGIKIAELDAKILETLLLADSGEEPYENEYTATEEYEDKIRCCRRKIKDYLKSEMTCPETSSDDARSQSSGSKSYKLPKLELKKFGGDLKSWLNWWSQFQRVHLDDSIHPSDKFQYLIQATEEGSRARRLVEGYPQTSENYPKIVEALQDRFGDKTILTEFYVRQLAGLVIENASKSKKTNLSFMFDEVESSLRSLESLGVKSDESAAFLYPLVESSLPEEVLKVWQRCTLSGYNDEDGNDRSVADRLSALMKFLRKEVKGEQRLSFVYKGFENANERKKRLKPVHSDIPTAAGLLTHEPFKCVFCDKAHEAKDCGRASELTLEDKNKIIRQKKCCYSCLRPGHAAKKCRSFVKCHACAKRHYVVMCPELSKNKTAKVSDQSQSASSTEVHQSLYASSSRNPTMLQTLKVKIIGRTGLKTVRALIDTGAQKSYILNTTAEGLGLNHERQLNLRHGVFGGQCSAVEKYNEFKVSLCATSAKTVVILKLLGHRKICSDIPPIPTGPWLKNLRKRGVVLSDVDQSGPIEILLGADSCSQIYNGKFHRISPQLIAVDTKLGWTVMGDLPEEERLSSVSIVTSCLNITEVNHLWDLETIGIKDPVETKSKKERNLEVKAKFQETLTMGENNRYIVKLPWKSEIRPNKNNRVVAERRLQNTVIKLKKSNQYAMYDTVFQKWLEEGLIEQVQRKDSNVHYLPHRPVFKPESLTTPVRPVFDASCCSYSEPSLNDLLEKGPNMIEMIPSLILRFRSKKIGVTADIRKAFQTIEVHKDDRDFLRFLWMTIDEELIEFRHKRVVFGVSSSPFLLAAVLDHHLANKSRDEVAKSLLHSFYVDNCVTSVESEKELFDFKTRSIDLLQEACMDLREWHFTGEGSGVGPLLGSGCGLEPGRECHSSESTKCSAVLGIQWNMRKDSLVAVIPERDELLELSITKRNILATVARIFDPIGYLSPVTLLPKLWLQQLWARKTKWDEEVEGEVRNYFHKWVNELHVLKTIGLQRHCFLDSGNKIQLHIFCDASSSAYATVIFARSKVAPAKRITIPRVELLSCLIGARLGDHVKTALSLPAYEEFYWSDSTTALAWIRKNADWGTYVGNRTKEINRLTDVTKWRHVPGELNPADIPSRGLSPSAFKSSAWWEGPKWLLEDETLWPSQEPTSIVDEVNAERMKSKVQTLLAYEQSSWFCARYSDYHKNLRLIGWIRRFVLKTQKQNFNQGALTVEELNDAESHVFRLVQAEAFPTNSVHIEGLKVVRENRLYRVATKITRRPDFYDFRFPVLLPGSHPLMTQFILHHHRENGHAGVQVMMSILREKVWILKARKSIKSALKECLICRKEKLKPAIVVPSDLPANRVCDSRPFETTGVDLAGPLFLKNGSKSWIVLFTCAVYRCVHLELVLSLSTEAFVGALQKFVCRRGRPSVIWSDNGTNFKGANTAFRKINWIQVEKNTESQRITWKFIPPTAAWWGGWWERLIRSIKELLKRMLGWKKVSGPQLESLLCEVESAMNSRPLTYISEDQNDLVPLTPQMFLQPLPSSQFPEAQIMDGEAMRKSRTNLLQMRTELQNRFRKEYLSLLVHRAKGEKPTVITKGDLVLIGSDNKKRLFWPMGRIVDLISGADGHSRVAKVKTKTGVLTRPIQRLYPLEIRSEGEKIFDTQNEKPDDKSLPKKTRYGRVIKMPNYFTPT